VSEHSSLLRDDVLVGVVVNALPRAEIELIPNGCFELEPSYDGLLAAFLSTLVTTHNERHLELSPLPLFVLRVRCVTTHFEHLRGVAGGPRLMPSAAGAAPRIRTPPRREKRLAMSTLPTLATLEEGTRWLEEATRSLEAATWQLRGANVALREITDREQALTAEMEALLADLQQLLLPPPASRRARLRLVGPGSDA
jgi:hypothetical protein